MSTSKVYNTVNDAIDPSSTALGVQNLTHRRVGVGTYSSFPITEPKRPMIHIGRLETLNYAVLTIEN